MSTAEIRQSILDAIDMVNKQTYTVCAGSDQHLVHPAEAESKGLVRCAACFQVIGLGDLA